MAFDKTISSQISEYKLYNVTSTDELIKEASDIDFPEGFVYDPDFFYMWIRIVSAGDFYGSNKNADYFPEEELVAYWETFNEAHPFKNHENKNVENAIGKIISVRWNPLMKCVELLKAIDKKRAPEIVRGYQKGYLTDVSMGCKVPYTVCSVCGNKARRRSEFCDHVKYHRNQMLGNGERVYEINYKPRFHDSSTVLNGAERVAKAFYIMDTPPEGDVLISSFRKSASTDRSVHYIRLSEEEMTKVAALQDAVHPLLKEEVLDKIATDSPMMRKIAEIEKQLTGKLLNIVSTPNRKKLPAMKQMLEVIKFLTEKRLDEASLKNIALSVKEVAKMNQVDSSRAFATLIGVAELLGVEFFPKELHTILRHLTDAGLNSELELSEREGGPVYPGEFAKGIQRAMESLDGLGSCDHPSHLMKIYDDTAHHLHSFSDNPFGFLSSLKDEEMEDFEPPVQMIRVLKKTLSPIVAVRSYRPNHLYPRLSAVLNGHKAIMGDHSVRQDLGILSDPLSAGDLLSKLTYGMYQDVRPKIIGLRLTKVAADEIGGLEKEALFGFGSSKDESMEDIISRQNQEARSQRRNIPDTSQAKPKGTPHIGYVKKPRVGLGIGQLALGAVPLAYGASALEKSRRENGRYLSDGENFVADHPGLVAGGAILAGRPLSKAVATGVAKGKNAIGDLITKIKEPFTKMADEHFEALVKVADNLSSGAFNVFDGHEVLSRYKVATGATNEQASAVKMATILSAGGMDKEAYAIMDFYNIPNQEKGHMLKIAADYLDEEMTKAAEDFTNNMILSAIGDTNPLARTLPGRAVDALIFKKLGDLGKTPEPKVNEVKGADERDKVL